MTVSGNARGVIAVLFLWVAQAASAQRIVTLAPSLTELVYAAGAGDKLVGVSAYSDYPVAASRLPQVADASGISWESLLVLKPDLVLAWKTGTRAADMARMTSLGLEVASIDVAHLEDVPSALRSIGKLSGRIDAAEAAARDFARQLSNLRKANTGKRVVKTFVEISARPLMTVNRDHVISEMLTLCGGENVFADSPTLVSEPTRELLLKRGAEAILFGQSSNHLERSHDVSQYEGLAAYRVDRIYGVTADYLFRPGPRLMLATTEICAALDRARASMKDVSATR